MLQKASPNQKQMTKAAVNMARKHNPAVYFHAIKRLTKWSK